MSPKTQNHSVILKCQMKLDCAKNIQEVSKNSPTRNKCSSLTKTPKPETSSTKSSFVYEDVLQDVVAYLEVRSDLEDLSALFGEHLLYLGATVSKTFNKKVTHVVFKNGKESTFKKAKERNIPVVNVLWLDGCKKEKSHIPEEPFIIKEYNTYGKRKRLIINSKFNFDDLTKSFEESKKIVDQIKASRKSEIFLAPETPVQPPVLNESFPSPNVIPETVLPTTKKFKTVINKTKLSPVQPMKRKLFSEPSGIVLLGANETKLYNENVSELSVKESTPKPKKETLDKPQLKTILHSTVNPKKDYVRSPLKDNNVKKTKVDDSLQKKNKKLNLNLCENGTSRSPKLISGLSNSLNIDVTKARQSLEDFKKNRRKRNKMKDTPTIVFTSFSASMIEVAHSIVKSLGGFNVTNNVGNRTTHVICGEQKRTLNVLYGLVQGCYLLSTDWLMKSLEARKWIDESPFELIESFASAEVRKNEIGTIFKDCGTFFISPYSAPPANDLSNLILMGGGMVTSCLRKCTIIVGNFNDSSPLEKYSAITRVNEKCILDCISSLNKFST